MNKRRNTAAKREIVDEIENLWGEYRNLKEAADNKIDSYRRKSINEPRYNSLERQSVRNCYYVIKPGIPKPIYYKPIRNYALAKKISIKLNGIVTNRSTIFRRNGKVWKAPEGLKRFFSPDQISDIKRPYNEAKRGIMIEIKEYREALKEETAKDTSFNNEAR